MLQVVNRLRKFKETNIAIREKILEESQSFCYNYDSLFYTLIHAVGASLLKALHSKSDGGDVYR